MIPTCIAAFGQFKTGTTTSTVAGRNRV